MEKKSHPRHMLKKTLTFVVGILLVIGLAGNAHTDTIKGKVTKVAKEGRQIFVASGAGKTIRVNISGRTVLEGVGDRSEIKVGQVISANVEGGRAIKLKIIQ